MKEFRKYVCSLILMNLVCSSLLVSADDRKSDFEFDELPATAGDKHHDHNNSQGFHSSYVNENRFDEDVKQSFKSYYPKVSLCDNVRCSKHEKCLVVNKHGVVCVKKKMYHMLRKEAKKSRGCKPCHRMSSSFVCGSDNHIYYSACELRYQNCLNKKSVQVDCHGSCPCPKPKITSIGSVDDEHFHLKTKMMKKYKKTMTKKNSFNFHKHSKKNKSSLSRNKHWKISNDHENNILKSVYKEKHAKKCTEKDLKIMGNRLLDWFTVIKSTSGNEKFNFSEHGKIKVKFPRCMNEVQWMFEHFDKNHDSLLSLKELYSLEHDEHEHCIKPFLDKCDYDQDIFLNPYEWCKCFDRSERPCAAMRSRARGLLGAFVPSCDDHGFFLPSQCHKSIGMCWCVDKHGIEIPNTRSKFRRDCEAKQQHNDDDDEDFSSIEGSASSNIN